MRAAARGPHRRARARPGGPGGARPRCGARRRGGARPAGRRPAATRPPPAPPACRPRAAAPCVCAMMGTATGSRLSWSSERPPGRRPVAPWPTPAPSGCRLLTPKPYKGYFACNDSFACIDTGLAFIDYTKARTTPGPVRSRMLADAAPLLSTAGTRRPHVRSLAEQQACRSAAVRSAQRAHLGSSAGPALPSTAAPALGSSEAAAAAAAAASAASRAKAAAATRASSAAQSAASASASACASGHPVKWWSLARPTRALRAPRAPSARLARVQAGSRQRASVTSSCPCPRRLFVGVRITACPTRKPAAAEGWSSARAKCTDGRQSSQRHPGRSPTPSGLPAAPVRARRGRASSRSRSAASLAARQASSRRRASPAAAAAARRSARLPPPARDAPGASGAPRAAATGDPDAVTL